MKSISSTVAVVVVAVVVVVARGVEGGREKRYIFVNPDAPITLGFILNMPISLALPTLAPKFGRALDEVGGGPGEWETDGLQKLARHRHLRPEQLSWDPAYDLPLSHLTAYFSHLELPTLPCQERLLCELAAEPETFEPINQIFMKELRQLYGPVNTSQDSLMWRYMMAVKEGFRAHIEECAVKYEFCPLPADRILNMPVLKVWQYIASKLNLQLV
ncbi:uncharacterized protein LOC123507230 [Portunus trituberculatus]|uniref:uncharacterized protein LOC123507230 n=1 Tax=Portunus trituberculatus TaxID=210409 RepID=UPI001E1D023B|nr:uncharacterized protein LOC123507230 [Portunus trituberculatus]XP_045115898.1 uncharacterized protein LOC123507230 [Portunus trituberculatus]